MRHLLPGDRATAHPLARSRPARTVQLMVPAVRSRPARGLTMVEMAVVLALAALILAWALPRVVGTETMAQDQRAQTTASGALDTAVQLYLRNGAAAGQTDPVCAGVVAQPPAAATTVPVFANPCALRTTNGDVGFVPGAGPGAAPSTDAGTASVAAQQASDGSWRVGVAVLSPVKRNSVSSCLMAWRSFTAGAGTVSAEAYFTHTNVSAADAGGCTGTAALVKTLTDVSDRYCLDRSLGSSWRRPCPDFYAS